MGVAEEPQQTLTVSDVFRLIAGAKWLTAVCVATLVVIAVIISATGAKTYRVQYIVEPVQRQGNALGSLFNQISMLRVGSSEPAEFDTYLQLLTSKRLADRIVATTPLLRKIFDKDWDPSTHQWKQRTFAELGLLQRANILLGGSMPRPPDSFALAEYLDARLQVLEMSDRTHYSVTIDTRDPGTAQQLLGALHAGANQIMKETQYATSRQEKAYLLDQLKGTTNNDDRTILLQLLSRIETEIISTSAQGDYAGRIVDGPNIDPVPVFPRPMRYIEFAIIGGVLLGISLAIFTPLSDEKLFRGFNALRRRRARPSADRVQRVRPAE